MDVDDPEAPASKDDMDLSNDNGDEREDDAVHEGEDDTEDEGAGGDGSGSNDGGGDGDGFNSSFNGGLMSLPIIRVISHESEHQVKFMHDYFECGSVPALELRVKGILRRKFNRDTFCITYSRHMPNVPEMVVDINRMSWDEVMHSELQGAFVLR
ncbi:hypothetical protein Pyn_23482 [Prunus yedoensis var. nudiflora]|uniref:Uncharacterized protein n=1 Tax=Prunus yedoensis var. nudiflora TaxID=2094558 RepID=A0A314ZMD7_PRUYE|nr:hypothetical protein Pyn_23482 [Prunus yedoensis var. nudiflora]